MSVVSTYCESRVGRAHVHVGRYVGLLSVIAVGWAIGIAIIMVAAEGPTVQIVELVGVASIGSWLPALLLTVGWHYRGDQRAR